MLKFEANLGVTEKTRPPMWESAGPLFKSHSSPFPGVYIWASCSISPNLNSPTHKIIIIFP